MGGRRATLLAVLLAASALAPGGCAGSEGDPAAEPSPSRTITTLEPLPPPPGGPPDGRLVADLRQSSRDVSYGRFQIWIGNGLAGDLRPRSITYLDPRFRHPLTAERLRRDPSGSERGYPLALPRRPRCGGPGGRGRAAVTTPSGRHTVSVADEAEVVGRYVFSRCLELDVGRVAQLSFADEVAVDDEADPAVATLVLRAQPTGGAGVVTVRRVTGTPVLTSAPGVSWSPGRRVAGNGPPVRIPLRAVVTRCDPHVFQESTGATTFRVRVTADGRAGDVLLPMGPEGATAALDYATGTCGL